uniref:Uncharacterized protein n=1 Tax=Caenorhabditis japonica TaxID=281687 RepID=A0A8R1E6U1_CAEJA
MHDHLKRALLGMAKKENYDTLVTVQRGEEIFKKAILEIYRELMYGSEAMKSMKRKLTESDNEEELRKLGAAKLKRLEVAGVFSQEDAACVEWNPLDTVINHITRLKTENINRAQKKTEIEKVELLYR